MVDRQPELTTINTPETEQEEENADRDGFSGCSNNGEQTFLYFMECMLFF
jgi:hypothetical protein